jgi:hypothetical protein
MQLHFKNILYKSLLFLQSLDYKKQRQLEEAAEEKASSKDEVAIEKQENDKTEEGAEAEEDPNGSNVEGWFGIKPDEGTREQRRLFVHDRRLSKTEKVFPTFHYPMLGYNNNFKLLGAFASPGIRVLRNHLRVQTDEGSSNISTSAAKSSLEQKQTRGRPSKSDNLLIMIFYSLINHNSRENKD